MVSPFCFLSTLKIMQLDHYIFLTPFDFFLFPHLKNTAFWTATNN
jgi:hypothetical protein